MQNSKKEIVTITLKLLVICSIVAVIVAFVNTVTKDKIAQNALVSTAEALTGIYSEDFGGKSFEVKDGEFVIEDGKNLVAKCTVADHTSSNKDISAIYVLTDSGGASLGYCVSISPMGFKAAINMLVAVNADMTVRGVKIVSMSETSGIGTKAQDESFLSKFVGLNADSAASVDAISGATKTSQPVINATSLAVKEVELYVNKLGGAAK